MQKSRPWQKYIEFFNHSVKKLFRLKVLPRDVVSLKRLFDEELFEPLTVVALDQVVGVIGAIIPVENASGANRNHVDVESEVVVEPEKVGALKSGGDQRVIKCYINCRKINILVIYYFKEQV